MQALKQIFLIFFYFNFSSRKAKVKVRRIREKKINEKYFTQENDKLVSKLTGFDSFKDLVEQKKYRPTIHIDGKDSFRLAECYDQYMKEAGEERRAYRVNKQLKALDVINADSIIDSGFKKFNGYDHLPVCIPLTGGTITCNLPNGKKITFSFIPTGNGDIECCDIQLETGSRCKNFPENEKQHIIAFNKGNRAFDSRSTDTEVTLTTVLINDEYYK